MDILRFAHHKYTWTKRGGTIHNMKSARLTITPSGSPILCNTSPDGWTTVSAPLELIRYIQPGEEISTHQSLIDAGGDAAVIVLRPGTNYRPFGDASGVCKLRSTLSRPLIIMSDDSSSARPTILSNGGGCFIRQGSQPMIGVKLLGLHFAPSPGDAAISWIGPGFGFYGEDLELVNGQYGLNLLGNENGSPCRFRIVRSIIHGQRSFNGHAQGCFVGAAQAYPELHECIIDDIGATNKDQSIYVTNGSGALALTNCIITRIHGGHAAQGRSGLIAYNNVIARCASALLAGGGDNPQNDPTGVEGDVHDNYFQEPVSIGWGVEFSNCREVHCEENIFAHGPNSAFAIRCTGIGQGLGSGIGCPNINIYNNVHEGPNGWRGGIEILKCTGHTDLQPHTFTPTAPGRSIQTYYAHLKGRDGTAPGDFNAYIANAKASLSYHNYDPTYLAKPLLQYLREGQGIS